VWGKELTDIETMISSIEKEITTAYHPHVESWEEKIKRESESEAREEEERVRDEETFMIRTGRTLLLDKVDVRLGLRNVIN
jgi:hypothetical protein